MEKTALIQELRTRVGEDNCKVISDRTFEGVAESVLSLFADDSAITEDTYKLPVATLNQFAGQKRFDDAAFAEKFKKDYAAEYTAKHEKDAQAAIDAAVAKALEDYKKEHPEHKTETKPEDIDTKISAMLEERFKALTGAESDFGKMTKSVTDFLDAQQKREKTELKKRVKAELKKHLLDLKADNEACVDDALDDLEYGDEPSFDALKQPAITAYEQRYKRYYGDGGKPFGGSGQGGTFSKEQMDDYIKRAEARAKDAEEYRKGIQFTK